MASRLDLYRSVHDLLETDYKSIPEYSLYYDSCLEWGINAEGFTLNGYNGKTRHLRTTTVGQGIADFKSEWSQGIFVIVVRDTSPYSIFHIHSNFFLQFIGMVGRAYTTLTDNKTFAFTAACFSDNQMSWNVFATTKTLDEATKNQIFEHAKSLGYNPEYFTEIRYDSCKSKSEITTAGSTEFENEVASSSENEISDRTIIKPSVSDLEQDSFCTSCKRICPNILAKSEFMHKYYKKLRKHHKSSD